MSSFAPGSPPSVDALFAEWWGGPPADPFFTFDTGAASNLVFGGNPVYQVSDFLAIYPKFGSQQQAVQSVVPNATTPGAAYVVGDQLVVVQPDASGCVLQVTAVTGGVPTAYAVVTPGTGYSVAVGLGTTGGTGVGALVNVTAIDPFVSAVPQAVIQLYINLASACLQQVRWLELWPMAMALYVAHFLTLYLQSEGNPTSTPGQIAISGLSKGIAVSKAAGDVSVSYETLLSNMADWGSWALTTYGQQLVTFARVIGSGPMYIYG